MTYPPARCTMRLRFPIDLPGGTIDRVTLDLDRQGRGQISRIIGLPVSVIDEMTESDYVRILLKIEELNKPRLGLRVAG